MPIPPINTPKGPFVSVRVVPGARKVRITVDEGGVYRVHVTARAVEGQANDALLEILADAWGVKKRCLQITKGLKSRQKLIKITVI